MVKFYSKVDPTRLLHMVVTKKDFKSGRTDLIPSNQFIQCAMLEMEARKTFKPHKHIWKERTEKVIAQESWVCIQGSVKCTFYDLDDTVLAEYILYEGDASFTLEGGHNYTIREDNTFVYEFKTGPYYGQEFDKTFIV